MIQIQGTLKLLSPSKWKEKVQSQYIKKPNLWSKSSRKNFVVRAAIKYNEYNKI